MATYIDGYKAYGNGAPYDCATHALMDDQPMTEWLRGWMDARSDSYRHGGSLLPNANDDIAAAYREHVEDRGRDAVEIIRTAHEARA